MVYHIAGSAMDARRTQAVRLSAFGDLCKTRVTGGEFSPSPQSSLYQERGIELVIFMPPMVTQSLLRENDVRKCGNDGQMDSRCRGNLPR